MKKILVTLLLSTLMQGFTSLRGDDGMYLVNLMEKGLIKDMRAAGLKLPPNVIYDESQASISDAIIALDFFCSGSIISDKGLLITNHHCAYGDVHALSTPEHNYLEEGFWAFKRSEEKPIPGRSAFFLRKVIDVTQEVDSLSRETGADKKKMGSRKLAWVMETKYQKEYGMEASLGSMWKNSKYYMFLYDRFSDVRLVAAPPVSIAAFGGDIDNWEWPQHKGDFAIYRVYSAPDGSPAEYSPDNVPMVPKRHLAISTKGVKMGDYTMILGYPGRTNRYSSSFEADFVSRIQYPMTTPAMKGKMDIISDWSEKNDTIRLKYADQYFSISNVQENYEGAASAITRYGIVSKKQAIEKELQEWLDKRNDPRKEIITEIGKVYQARIDAEKELIKFRNGIVGSCAYFSMTNRIKSSMRKSDSTLLSADTLFMKWSDDLFSSTDSRVEHDLFVYALTEYAASSSREFRGNAFNKMLDKFNGDGRAMAEWVWNNSFITDRTRFTEFISDYRSLKDVNADSFVRVLSSISIKDINDKIDKTCSFCPSSLTELKRRYTQALYEMRCEKGITQYPDANSTMRLTYGNVCDLHPRDGIRYAELSTASGILEKYDPSVYDFHLNDRQHALLEKKDWGRWGNPDGTMTVNFLSTNDITGGNSGSAVLNGRGELIGLAFDGNKESLCSDFWFEPRYCKCVNVDIRYVLWILDKYAGMNYLFDELELI
ncbi:MAG: S46 family peptidase [Alistipes sp.]|nr:S46 family peptidase [Candidatus Minthomonas equi]